MPQDDVSSLQELGSQTQISPNPRLVSLASISSLPHRHSLVSWSSAAGLYNGRKHNSTLHPLQSPTLDQSSLSARSNFAYAAGSKVVLLDELNSVQDILQHSCKVVAVSWAQIAGLIAVATEDRAIHVYAPSESVTQDYEQKNKGNIEFPSSLWHHEFQISMDSLVHNLAWFLRNDTLYLASAGTEISVWSIAKLPQLQMLPLENVWHMEIRRAEDPSETSLLVDMMGISSDGRLFACSFKDSNIVLVWDMVEAQSRPMEIILSSRVSSLEWYMNSRDIHARFLPCLLKIHSTDGKIYFWKEQMISTAKEMHLTMYCVFQLDANTVKAMKSNKKGLKSYFSGVKVGCKSPSNHMVDEKDIKFTSSSWLENLRYSKVFADSEANFEQTKEDVSKNATDVSSSANISRGRKFFLQRKRKKSLAFLNVKDINSRSSSRKNVHYLPKFKPDITIQKPKTNFFHIPWRHGRRHETEKSDKLSRFSKFGMRGHAETSVSSDYNVQKTSASTVPDTSVFQNILVGRDRILYHESIQNNQFATIQQHIRLWFVTLNSLGHLSIFCIENIFNIHPGGVRIVEYMTIANAVPLSVAEESPVQMFATSTFFNPFSWNRPPRYDIDSLNAPSKGYSANPDSLRLYLLSESKSEVHFRNWIVRLNESSSELISKLGGHRRPLASIFSHKVLPYAGSLSHEGHVILWKIDFPHVFSALDQERCGSGMLHLTSVGGKYDKKKYDQAEWLPSREHLLLVCLSRCHAVVDVYMPIDEENAFVSSDQSWELIHQLPIPNCGIYTQISLLDSSFLDRNGNLITQFLLAVSFSQRIQIFNFIAQSNPNSVVLKPVLTLDPPPNMTMSEISAFSWNTATPRRKRCHHQSVDVIIGCIDGSAYHIHLHLQSQEGITRNLHLLCPPTGRRIVSVDVVSTTHFITASDSIITLWEADSLDKFQYRRSLEVSSQNSNMRILYTYCVLGDGVIRFLTAESMPTLDVNGQQSTNTFSSLVSQSLRVTLHLPLRGSTGRDGTQVDLAPWRSVEIDISRFLHRYHRYARGKNIYISSIKFASHGSLIVGLRDSLCFIPAHRLFLMEECTAILPVPLYHPDFLHELLLSNRIQFVNVILKQLVAGIPYLGSNPDDLDAFPQPALDQILNFLDSSNSVSADLIYTELTQKDFECLHHFITTKKLPYLGSRDNLNLLAILNTVKDISHQSRILDPCGVRFLVAFRKTSFINRTLRKNANPIPLTSVDVAWALHSQMKDSLLQLSLVSEVPEDELYSWEQVKNLGVGYWIDSDQGLRNLLLKVATSEYKKRRNPLDAMLYYLILDKLSVLKGLLKSCKNDPSGKMKQMAEFFSKDFTEKGNQDKATDFAFGLIRKQKYRTAAGFMLLAGKIEYSIRIIARNLGDFQLSIVICRLCLPNYRQNPSYLEVMNEVLLPYAIEKKDIWLHHVGLWLLGEKSESIRILVPWDHSSNIFRPDVSFFFRHIKNSAVSKALGLSLEFVDDKDLPTIFYESAKEYNRLGWSMLALEQLMQISNGSETRRDSDDFNSSDPGALLPVSSLSQVNVGHSIAQLQQDIIHSALAMRVALRTYVRPLKQKQLKSDLESVRERLKNVESSNVKPTPQLLAEKKNPFGFKFEAFEDSDDESNEEDEKSVNPAFDNKKEPLSMEELNAEKLKFDSSAFSILDELKLFENNFHVNHFQAVDAIKQFCRSHHFFLTYLDLQLEFGQSKSIFGFVRSELDSLLSLIHTADISAIPLTKVRRLISCASVLNAWRVGVRELSESNSFKGNEKAEEAIAVFAENEVLIGMIYIVLFTAAIARKHYTALMTLISSECLPENCSDCVDMFANDSAFKLPAASVIEKYRWDYAEHGIHQHMIDNMQSSEGTLEETEITDVVDRIFLASAVISFLKIFNCRYTDPSHSRIHRDPNFCHLKSISEAFLVYYDEELRDLGSKLDIALDYCVRSYKTKIRLSDILVPLLMKFEDPVITNLFNILEATSLGQKLHDELMIIAKEPEKKYQPYYPPVEIYRNNQDFPTCVVANPCNPEMIAFSAGDSLLEMNVESSLRFRKRHGEHYQCIDQEDTGLQWEQLLHRFIENESQDRKPHDEFMFPVPELRVAMLSKDSSLMNSHLPKVSQVSYFSNPIYKKFTRKHLAQLSEPADRKEMYSTIAVHPTVPFYLTSNLKDQIHLWEWEWPTPYMNYKNPGLDRITKIRFSSSGTKFAATGGNGKLAIWNLDFNPQGVSCLQMVDAHSRVAWDLQFLGNDSLIATCGSAHRAGNVRIFDMLSPPSQALISKVDCPSDLAYTSALAFLEESSSIITGSCKGQLCLYDLRQRQVRVEIPAAHHSRIQCLDYNPLSGHLISGCVDGTVKLWDLRGGSFSNNSTPLVDFGSVFEKRTFFSHPTAVGMMSQLGVTSLTSTETGFLGSGADGTIKFFKAK